MITVIEYVRWSQPEIAIILENITRFFIDVEELTPEQQYLDRLMRQVPKPPKFGGAKV